MTQEEKAKYYDEIIKKANKMHHENCEACQMCIEELIPELVELEDERIRQELIDYINSEYRHTLDLDRKNIFIAWLEKQGKHANFRNKIQIGDKVTRNKDGMLVNLSQLNRVAKKDEKQGEQNPAWSEEDDYNIEILLCLLDNEKENYPRLSNYVQDIEKTYKWLKSLKERVQHKQEWSEEDKTKINYLIALLQNCTMNNDSLRVMNEEIEDWLKSLHPSWKPSDEQMEALYTYIYNPQYFNSPDPRMELVESVYKDLKKLKG